jgi:predicted nucleotidyltransferase component of viral defense system
LSVLDRQLVEQVAGALAIDEGLVEKDWHVVRALAVIAAVDHGDAAPAFSGGTSLSKGWGLIKRFSEDIDFKVAMPVASSLAEDRRRRGAYRRRILDALIAGGFTQASAPLVHNASRFFSVDLAYPSAFDVGPGLRPHIRVEMSFQVPSLPPLARPIQSLIAMAHHHSPEVPAFPCIDPVETAADKLSALAWRVLRRQRGAIGDDATLIRHLHDLAALARTVAAAPTFTTLVLQAAAIDADRGGEATVSSDLATLFAGMIERLRSDRL